MATVIVGSLVLSAFVGVGCYTFRKKGKGGACSGGCSGCPNAGACHGGGNT